MTPIVQTVDTHFNQHAKRKYLAKEGAALLRQMQLGKCVPQLRHVDCIDLMVEVCEDTSLHLGGANGFVETGLKVNLLDANLDAQIVKEAGFFWRKLGMREKVAAAVAEVKEEVSAGRLRWCFKDIMRQIIAHPRKQHVDDVLANMCDDTALVEEAAGDRSVEKAAEDRSDAGTDADECDEDAISEGNRRQDEDDDDDDDDQDWGNERDLEEWRAVEAPRSANVRGAPAVAGVSPALPPGVSEKQAEEAVHCNDMMRVIIRARGVSIPQWNGHGNGELRSVSISSQRDWISEHQDPRSRGDRGAAGRGPL